jgi:hypothetical protein
MSSSPHPTPQFGIPQSPHGCLYLHFSPSVAIPAEVHKIIYLAVMLPFCYFVFGLCYTESGSGRHSDCKPPNTRTRRKSSGMYVMSGRCSTLHRIEEKEIQLDFLSVMSNVHDSNKSFSNQKQTALVGGWSAFLTLFKMKVTQGHAVYLLVISCHRNRNGRIADPTLKMPPFLNQHSVMMYRGRIVKVPHVPDSCVKGKRVKKVVKRRSATGHHTNVLQGACR